MTSFSCLWDLTAKGGTSPIFIGIVSRCTSFRDPTSTSSFPPANFLMLSIVGWTGEASVSSVAPPLVTSSMLPSAGCSSINVATDGVASVGVTVTGGVASMGVTVTGGAPGAPRGGGGHNRSTSFTVSGLDLSRVLVPISG